MANLKDIAATLAILGSGALVMSGCGKDKPATETPAGAGGAGGAEASCGAEKAEGSCGAEKAEGGEASCSGEAKPEGEGEASCSAEGEGEGSCGAN